MTIKKKLAPLVENVTESGVACLVTMVQGNLMMLGVSHWLIASQTGLAAGVVAAAAIAVARTGNRLFIAGILGLLTAIVDHLVHPGMIAGPKFTEAVVTGLGAAVLSYTVGTILSWIRRRRAPISLNPGVSMADQERHG